MYDGSDIANSSTQGSFLSYHNPCNFPKDAKHVNGGAKDKLQKLKDAKCAKYRAKYAKDNLGTDKRCR